MANVKSRTAPHMSSKVSLVLSNIPVKKRKSKQTSQSEEAEEDDDDYGDGGAEHPKAKTKSPPAPELI